MSASGRLTPLVLRQSLRLAVVMFVTASIALWSDRASYLWYSLNAALVVVDDNDDLTIPAGRRRILGTILGALVTFVVHTIASGWMAVLVACMLCFPLLRLFGWQGGLSTAVNIIVMFLMIPRATDLNWDFVFNRSLDSLIGIVVAVGVSFLFWPRNRLAELERLDLALDHQIRGLERGSPADLTAAYLNLARLVDVALRSQQAGLVQRKRWPQRLLLWETLLHHTLELDRHRALQQTGLGSPLLRAAIADEQLRIQQALRSMDLCRQACR
jgi:uncharacterized membrane protein YccC